MEHGKFVIFRVTTLKVFEGSELVATLAALKAIMFIIIIKINAVKSAVY